jgi:hypothetical protein
MESIARLGRRGQMTRRQWALCLIILKEISLAFHCSLDGLEKNPQSMHHTCAEMMMAD